jgi:hypothetical protein
MKEDTTTTETASTKLWNKIKDAPIDIFGLPNQLISQWVQREEKLEQAEPGAIFLQLKTGAVLPALEQALYSVRLGKSERFSITQVDKYTVIKIIPKN